MLIEQWGSGIPKILMQAKEYGLPDVEFIDMGIALRVNMFRVSSKAEGKEPSDKTQITSDKTQIPSDKAQIPSDKTQITSDKNKRQKASDTRAMFAEYLSQYGASSTAEISEFSGLSPQRTRSVLAKMVKDNVVATEGSNKTRKYSLNNNIS